MLFFENENLYKLKILKFDACEFIFIQFPAEKNIVHLKGAVILCANQFKFCV